MKRVFGVIAAVAASLLVSTPTAVVASGTKVRASEPAPLYMRVYGQAAPPYGFVDFCSRSPEECASGPTEDGRFVATPERLAELEEINRAVNTAIEPATDKELYGVDEHWTLPANGRGDCEDYALLKRHILIKRGWPISSLLMTVVFDEKGEGHAILTARVAQGDFVLDNKVATVKPWASTGYRYVMRQSYLNPRVWMSLDAKDARPPNVLSGVRGKR